MAIESETEILPIDAQATTLLKADPVATFTGPGVGLTLSAAESVLRTAIAVLEHEKAELVRKCNEMAEHMPALEYQRVIDAPPQTPGQLYGRACSNDGITVDSWEPIWKKHIIANKELFDFEKNSAMLDHGKFAYKPGIIIGSGPSLKKNIGVLREKQNENVAVIACLHSFAFLEDNGIRVDYYLNLDAGDITIPEMAQGGKQSPEYYWDLTKDRTLVTAITGHPDLIKKWKGRILFFNTLIPDQQKHDDFRKITNFNLYYNVGGCTLGACMYHARAILGCQPIVFMGADFSFSHQKKFHAWDSPYDQQFAGLIPVVDIFGNRAWTWNSYFNFNLWFQFQACGGKALNPGLFINCTEGGILGAWPEGNIRQITQMRLDEFFHCYQMHSKYKEMVSNKEQISLLY